MVAIRNTAGHRTVVGGAPSVSVLPASAVSPSTGSRIGFGLEPHEAFVGHPRIPGQAAHRRVPGHTYWTARHGRPPRPWCPPPAPAPGALRWRRPRSPAATVSRAAVVLNGLPDRDDPAAMVVTVRCPHCVGRHVHGLPAPVRVGRDGTFGHRAAHCGATAGYWVVDPNGRVGVILRRHAKQASRGGRSR